MPARLRQRIADARATGRPVLVVLAGSNGAGKSTFFAEALSAVDYPFINADEIAKALSVTTGQSVADLAYDAMHRAEGLRVDLLGAHQSFLMETVLSDTQGAKLAFFADAQAAGYFLLFIHIRLNDVETSIARVTERVLNGGHDVPDDKLNAPFARTRENAAKALALADAGFVFDNSDPESPYRLVEIWEHGSCVTRSDDP